MVLFCDAVFSCVITLLVRTDRTKIGLWRVHMREKFSLVGVDGNAFNIMAYVKTAMREAGFSKEESSPIPYILRIVFRTVSGLVSLSACMIFMRCLFM